MERFPYTNFHEINLDWILEQVKHIREPSPEVQQKIEELTEKISTAEQDIDTLKSDSASMGILLKNSAHENLLDNSNFLRPINQRGQTRYTGSYGIDRWRCWGSGAMEVSSNGVSVQNSRMFQYFQPDKFFKGTLTFAALTTSGILLRTANTTSPYSVVNSLGCGFESGNIIFTLPEGYTYIWAAAYPGEYSIETLPAYIAKPATEEMLECSRYFRRISDDGEYAFCYTDGYLSGFTFPVEMRTTPTLSNGRILTVHPGSFTSLTINADVSATARGIVYVGVDGLTAGTHARYTSLDISADI